MLDEKNCKFCNKKFNNFRKDGNRISSNQFNSRLYCSNKCSIMSRNRNSYIFEDKIVGIRAKSGDYIIIDSDDFDKISNLYFNINKKGYAVNYVRDLNKRNAIYLHHIIVGKPAGGLVVDHINRNKLDNRKSNLRIVTQQINVLNSEQLVRSNTGIRNITKISDKSYRVEVKRFKITYRKMFKTLVDAVNYRDKIIINN